MIYKTLIAVSMTILPLIIDYFLKQRHKRKLKELKIAQNDDQNNHYYHCLFWTSKNESCRQHLYNNTECGDTCAAANLQTINKFIASAKFSISMCMYHLTLRQVTDELINARKRGVNVRIITDCVMSKMEHSKFKLLKDKFGFDVRVPPYQNAFMHHKYCVIDAEDPDLQKMFLGSLNLTLQGFVANFEFVVMTNNEEMVQCFRKEFDLLWEKFNEVPGDYET